MEKKLNKVLTVSNSIRIDFRSGIIRPHAIISDNHIERHMVLTNIRKLNLKSLPKKSVQGEIFSNY